jgi:hypothetical protein
MSMQKSRNFPEYEAFLEDIILNFNESVKTQNSMQEVQKVVLYNAESSLLDFLKQGLSSCEGIKSLNASISVLSHGFTPLICSKGIYAINVNECKKLYTRSRI